VYDNNINAVKTFGSAKIVGPVLGFEFKDCSYNSFSAEESIVLFFNLNRLTRSLWKQGRVRVEISGLGEKGRADQNNCWSFDLELKDYPFKRTLGIASSLPAQEFLPDYYEIKLTLFNGRRKVIDEETSRFIISPQEIVLEQKGVKKSSPV
jgi:hypothetical protein